jgi:putative pyruvate formate lyase activating enzyme
MKKCTLCPRLCRVDRTEGEMGKCRSGAEAVVASAAVHRDEEPPVSGTGGSGTIFFAGCGLRCIFCQNYPISHLNTGRPMGPEDLKDEMIRLQSLGVHNINIVTGTHFVPRILEAVLLARGEGMTLPILWNTGGYERVETLRLLDGVVDIYLADYKFSSPAAAARIASARDYPSVAEAALVEMARQVGPLVLDDGGIARRGVIVRHLVLPGGLSGTQRVIDFVARELPRGVALSLMSQYTPYGASLRHPFLKRKLFKKEYRAALNLLRASGISEGWTQEI